MGIYFSLRILWKSYMLSWRTKEENLLCLKYLGSIYFMNFSLSLTMKQLPSSVHSTILLFLLSWMRGILLPEFCRFSWWNWKFKVSCASVSWLFAGMRLHQHFHSLLVSLKFGHSLAPYHSLSRVLQGGPARCLPPIWCCSYLTQTSGTNILKLRNYKNKEAAQIIQ